MTLEDVSALSVALCALSAAAFALCTLDSELLLSLLPPSLLELELELELLELLPPSLLELELLELLPPSLLELELELLELLELELLELELLELELLELELLELELPPSLLLLLELLPSDSSANTCTGVQTMIVARPSEIALMICLFISSFLFIFGYSLSSNINV